MSVRVLEGREHYEAVFYCSTTMTAFGPVMSSVEVAEAFATFIGVDLRTLPSSELEARYSEFMRANVCECGELRVTKCYMCDSPSYENAVNGIHVEFYGDGSLIETHKCELEPEPTSGERYVCSYCRGDNGYNPRVHNMEAK